MLRNANLYIKLEKTEFHKYKVKFLKYIVS